MSSLRPLLQKSSASVLQPQKKCKKPWILLTPFGIPNLPICKVSVTHFGHTYLTQCSSGKCQGLAITAFNAGHTLGGTVWKIRSPTSGTILYAVNLNHTKERHLDGTILLKSGGASGVFEPLARPDLLITDAERTNAIGSRRKDKDAQLIG